MENTNIPIEQKEINEQKEQIKEQEIPKPEEKLENKIYNDIISEEIGLKDDYSIDEESFHEEEEYSLPLKKKRKMCELSRLLLNDNVEEFKKIIEKNKSLIKKKNLEGFSLIQYAALNGAFDCFIFLLSLKVSTNEDIEGFYLIHLPLLKAIKNKYKDKCIKMFNYIYNNLPEQRKYKDRLGRTYLHIIFEFNLSEALNNIIPDLGDLFVEDNSGQFAVNYIYLYDAYESFCSLAKNPDNMIVIYLSARQRFKENKISYLSGEEKFLENLLIYKNIRIIRILMSYLNYIQNELTQDLNIIYSKYVTLIKEKQDKENEQMNNPINELLIYIQSIFQGIAIKLEYLKTAIVYNKDCVNHLKLPENSQIKHYKKKKNIIENSDRLSCLIDEEDGIMLNNSLYTVSEIFDNGIERTRNYIKIFTVPTERKSCLNDILKCHDIKYIKALKYKSDNIKFSKLKKNNNEENPQSPIPKFWDNMNMELIEKNYFLFNDNKSQSINIDIPEEKEKEEEINKNESLDNELYFYQRIDADTYINQYSYENIFNTTGCVFEAIDIVMSGNANNAFALIRPPGHHAGYYGPVENTFEPSNGFCLVNNVAIGAAYTKYKYNETIKKIAIVDIDVHHGNGTEEIVEMLNFKNFSRPFNYEKICGVRIEDKRSINWFDFDDAKNVLFISTHIYDKTKPDNFYPYSGGEESNTQKDSDIYPGGIYNIPFEFKKNYPYEYRNILRTKIIPRLHKFKPDIIFISAGFDGHKMELINQNSMLLQENDFGYIAEQIQFVANKFCQGRLVAVLEGGYNANTGIISPFAQSAFAFVRHLNIAVNMIYCSDGKLTNHKRENLFNEEMEIYKNYVKEDEEEEKEDNKPRRSERLRHMKEIEKKEKKEKEGKDNGINGEKEMEGINEEQKKEKEEKEEKEEKKEKGENIELEIKDENKENKEEIKEQKEVEKEKDNLKIEENNNKDNSNKKEEEKENINKEEDNQKVNEEKKEIEIKVEEKDKEVKVEEINVKENKEKEVNLEEKKEKSKNNEESTIKEISQVDNKDEIKDENNNKN